MLLQDKKLFKYTSVIEFGAVSFFGGVIITGEDLD